MKKQLFLVSSFVVALTTGAQTVPNGDFENWTVNFHFDEPNGFTTSNTWSYNSLGSGNVAKVGSAYHANFAMQLTTVNSATDTVQGLLILGNAGPGGLSGGTPYTGTPDSISFYAKYNILPNDTAWFIVGFKTGGAINAMAVKILTGTQNTWKRFSVPTGVSVTPDSIIALISSSNLNGLKYPGSVITVDSISFIGDVNGFPNPSFENWTTVSTEDPDNWTGINFAVAPGAPLSLTKSTNAYSGSFSMRLESVPTLFNDTVGYVTNGYFGQNGPAGGLFINANADKLTGYYQYFPVGNDTALAGLFEYNNTNLLDQNIVKLPAKSVWTYFEVPLSYNSSPVADTLNIVFTSKNMFDSTISGLGSVLYIDNLNLYYLPLGIPNVHQAVEAKISPNPFQDVALLSFNVPAGTVSDVEIFNLAGEKVWKRESVTTNSVVIDRSGLSSGLYIYRITEHGKGKQIAEGKINVK